MQTNPAILHLIDGTIELHFYWQQYEIFQLTNRNQPTEWRVPNAMNGTIVVTPCDIRWKPGFTKFIAFEFSCSLEFGNASM